MPIQIQVDGVDYKAVVTPSPHMPGSRLMTIGPESGGRVITELLALGYHQQDIVDAFAEADPDFVTKMNAGQFDER